MQTKISRLRRTKIEWATHVWNPTTGCAGPHGLPCPWCYASAMARRFKRSFEPQIHPERLEQPLHTRKPARVFVDSAGDLFDPGIPDDFVRRAWNVMHIAKRHSFFILTKQPERMRAWYDQFWGVGVLPNVWLGVSVTGPEDLWRIPLLLQTPAAHRFISFEPLLSEIRVATWGGISWVVIGGLTGPGSIPPAVEWVGDLTMQCLDAGVPLFHKDSLHDLRCVGPGGHIGHSPNWRRDLP